MHRDIIKIEKIQRRATKFILNSSSADYKTRLIQTNLLPVMYLFELQDLLFVIKCLIKPTENFDVKKFLSFSTSITRSGTQQKLVFNHVRTNTVRHFFFHRVVKLWNSIPLVDLSLSFETVKATLYNHFWSHFITNFDSSDICSNPIVCPCTK